MNSTPVPGGSKSEDSGWLDGELTDIGSPKNRETAFAHGNLWGFKENQRGLWEHMEKGDRLLFYAGYPVSGIIGFGTLQSRFLQNIPLWPEEVNQGTVLWPLRIEFTVELLPRPVVPGKRPEPPLPPLLPGRVDARCSKRLRTRWRENYFRRFPKKQPSMFSAVGKEALPANLHDQTISHLLEIGRLREFHCRAGV